MELPSVASLEFEQLKASIKNYIKTKSDFTDFDFEGSNLSMLVDILAYNLSLIHISEPTRPY